MNFIRNHFLLSGESIITHYSMIPVPFTFISGQCVYFQSLKVSMFPSAFMHLKSDCECKEQAEHGKCWMLVRKSCSLVRWTQKPLEHLTTDPT